MQADTVSTGLREGDVVLLCSDGLSSYVPEADIAAVLAGRVDAGRRRARPGGPRQRGRRHGQRHGGARARGRRGRCVRRHGGGARRRLRGRTGRGGAHLRGARAGRRPRPRRQRARRDHGHPPAQGARARGAPPLAAAPDPRRRARAADRGRRRRRLDRQPHATPSRPARAGRCGSRTGCRCRSSGRELSVEWQDTGVSVGPGSRVAARRPVILGAWPGRGRRARGIAGVALRRLPAAGDRGPGAVCAGHDHRPTPRTTTAP